MIENIESKINLFLIGGRKCATTSLAACLSSHPSISVASNKEPEFFNLDKVTRSANYQEYKSLFDLSQQWKCDASTIYSAQEYTNENVAANIHNYNPNARIIYIVRNPFDRIISNYTMAYNRKYTRNSFDIQLHHKDLNLIALSKYYHQIKPYVDQFPRGQIHIMFFEDFVSNQSKSLKEVATFLNLKTPFRDNLSVSLNRDKDQLIVPQTYDKLLDSGIYKFTKMLIPKFIIRTAKNLVLRNTRLQQKPVFTDTQYQFAHSHLIDDIKQFEQLTSRNLNHWLR